MTTYYNEHDPYPAAWLRNLIAAGHIAPGVVDGRSVVDVRAEDVVGHARCHWFAGIAGWDLALQLAGWPDDLPVWTASLPCQPWSNAGRRRGAEDERHLWPVFFDLVRACRPVSLLGEQVASPDGRAWLDRVLADLEDAGYATGAADLSAGCVGAPHARQRLYWCATRPVGDADVQRRQDVGVQLRERRLLPPLPETAGTGEPRGVGDSLHAGLSVPERPSVVGAGWREEGRAAGEPSGAPWADAEWVICRDGKARACPPGVPLLAPRIPCRVGRVRAYGNAIVPQVGAVFARAVLDYLTEKEI